MPYLRTFGYWRDCWPLNHHCEGIIDRPLELGEKALAYVRTAPKSDTIDYILEWTVVDVLEDKMFRIEGRKVEDGKVSDEVYLTANWALFAASDGGSIFDRELHRAVVPGEPLPAENPGHDAEAMAGLQRALDKHFG
jgi:hypothetical protein